MNATTLQHPASTTAIITTLMTATHDVSTVMSTTAHVAHNSDAQATFTTLMS